MVFSCLHVSFKGKMDLHGQIMIGCVPKGLEKLEQSKLFLVMMKFHIHHSRFPPEEFPSGIPKRVQTFLGCLSQQNNEF